MKKWLLIIPILFWGCEKDFNPNTNYKYTFSAKVVKDEWGIETWGSHHFILDEKIKDMNSFKECYVNYLKWSGLDVDGLYNRIYYKDPKDVKIEFDGEVFTMWTVSNQDACQE